MRFGRRAGDAPADSGENSGVFIRRLKKGDNPVRFLDEMDEWTEYWEHFNPEGYSFPCTGEKKTCPGCTSNNDRMRRASKRYAVNVLRNGYVDVLQIPATLRDRLVTRSQRNGNTITDRDYVLIRTGEGLDTEYDYDQEPKAKLDLKQYQSSMHEVEPILAQAFAEAWPDIDVDEPPATQSKGSATRASMNKKPEGQEDPPSEPAQDKAESVQEDITVEKLQGMRLGQIIALLENDPDVADYPEDAGKQELIDWIVENFS